MNTLKPWMEGPAELIAHAEHHYRKGEEMDLRTAMVGYDNALEVSITTYLTLHPDQRGGRTYEGGVYTWLHDYNTKLDFLELEAAERQAEMAVPKDEILHFHRIRNEMYHGQMITLPSVRDINGIRQASLWVFAFLFDVADSADLPDDLILQYFPPETMQLLRNDEVDSLLDEEHGFIELAGQVYRACDVLAAVDPIAYRSLYDDLGAGETPPAAEAAALQA